MISCPSYLLRNCAILSRSPLQIKRTSLTTRLVSQKLIRHKTTEAGDEKSGHINTGPNEAIFFLDNVFPFLIKLNFLLGLSLLNADKVIPRAISKIRNPRVASANPTVFTKRAIPDFLPIEVKEILPRLKEGGAFVKFSHGADVNVKDVERQLRKYLKENPIKPWFSPFRRVRTFLVQGRPWVEDLHRFPSSRLKVEFLPTTPEGKLLFVGPSIPGVTGAFGNFEGCDETYRLITSKTIRASTVQGLRCFEYCPILSNICIARFPPFQRIC